MVSQTLSSPVRHSFIAAYLTDDYSLHNRTRSGYQYKQPQSERITGVMQSNEADCHSLLINLQKRYPHPAFDLADKAHSVLCLLFGGLFFRDRRQTFQSIGRFSYS